MTTNPSGREEAAPPLAVGQLGQSLASLIEESQALRSDVHAAERARRRAGRINLGLLAVLAGLALLAIFVTVQNNMLARRVDTTNARISDCTNPGGKCFEQGQQRTGQAVGDIVRSEIFMAECARLWPDESGPDYDKKLEACVAQRLAGPALRAAPSPTGSGK